jgi:hypothetical protein
VLSALADRSRLAVVVFAVAAQLAALPVFLAAGRTGPDR